MANFTLRWEEAEETLMKMLAEMTSLSEEKDGCHPLCCRMMKMREFKINVSLHFKILILGATMDWGVISILKSCWRHRRKWAFTQEECINWKVSRNREKANFNSSTNEEKPIKENNRRVAKELECESAENVWKFKKCNGLFFYLGWNGQ